MKKLFVLSIIGLQLIVIIIANAVTKNDLKVSQDYVIIAWNDLGMHCANKDFSKVAVLPPYNTVMAQVIKKGSSTSLPEIVTDSLVVSYEIPGNTYSVGKTNFWSYEDQLFGVNLSNDTGLTGRGLTGFMDAEVDHFIAEGIPLTPFSDSNLITENPYQLALLTLMDSSGLILATTQPVLPVSNEIGCVSSNCHPNEQHILDEHDNVTGFNSNGPVLCASCHSSNALGTAGTPGLESLSEVIHDQHENVNDCYSCHPGPNTQCHRGVMKTEGYSCSDCHGSTEQVAQSISNGREPWLEEPSCNATGCHSSSYAVNTNTLYRNSKGHGGLYCTACHGSPHAIYPSENASDNIQSVQLQGFAGQLSDCSICHTITPNMPGPHGIVITDVISLASDAKNTAFNTIYPNPIRDFSIVDFSVAQREKVSIQLFDNSGKLVLRLVNRVLESGTYQVELPASGLKSGIYYLKLYTGTQQDTKKLIKV